MAKKRARQGRQAGKNAKGLGNPKRLSVFGWTRGEVILPPPPQNLGGLGGLADLPIFPSGMKVAAGGER